MKVYIPKTILKIFTIIFISFFGFYIYEIYFNGLNSNYNFWCIQVESNFYINAIGNISLPIHCDEGPYRLASGSVENFFSKSNPYQTRPFYVLIISLIRQLVEVITFSQISDYQNFRFSMIIVQISLLSAIIFSIIFYLISIDYLGPYNEEIKYATINSATYSSVLLFLVLIYKQIKLKIER